MFSGSAPVNIPGSLARSSSFNSSSSLSTSPLSSLSQSHSLLSGAVSHHNHAANMLAKQEHGLLGTPSSSSQNSLGQCTCQTSNIRVQQNKLFCRRPNEMMWRDLIWAVRGQNKTPLAWLNYFVKGHVRCHICNQKRDEYLFPAQTGKHEEIWWSLIIIVKNENKTRWDGHGISPWLHIYQIRLSCHPNTC